MLVSIIVLTHNSEEFIERCIISLLACKRMYEDMEIIVVDNYSTDKTRDKIYEFPEVKVYQTGPERTKQANLGVFQSTGDVIYLTGSDMTRDIEFIEEGVQALKNGCDAIYMSVKTHPNIKHFWGKVKKLERECYIGTFIESTRFFKKSVWLKLNGFNEEMISMEEDFQHRLDQTICFTGRINSREYHMHEDESLIKIFKKAFYYGKYMKAYLRKHRGRALKQLNPIRPNYGKFLRHPKLLVGLVIYKIVQYIGGIGGLLCG